MPAAKPPQSDPPPPEKPERTDPGGPSPEVLERARRESGEHAPVDPRAGDPTLVYDKNKSRSRTPAGDLPRLVVTAGPRKGAEFPLAEPLTTIGRGEANAVVIPDISVSRQHSRLEKQGPRWVVLDQGSGNGTRVNGQAVERHALQNGDEIEMGDTRLRFVEPGGVLVRSGSSTPVLPRPVDPSLEAAPPSTLRRRAPVYGAVLAALALLFAAGLLRKQQRLRVEAAARAHQDESRELGQQRFQEGVALLKQGRWLEARDKLKIAAELNGQDPEIARYLESAENEAPRAEAVAQAKAALARKDYAGTKAALDGIPDDSALSGTAHEVAQQLRSALETAVRDAKARAEAGDAAGASDLLEPVLAADPSRPDALAVKEAIAGQKRTSPPPRPRERPQPQAKEAPPPAAAPDVESILEAYLSGDVGAAIERAQDARSSRGVRMLAELKRFDAAYKDGLARQQAKKPQEALRALEQATAADRAIAQGKEGRLGREVRKALSAVHTQIGAAQAAAGEDSLPQAAAHLRAAVQNDPANETAQTQLREVSDRAREIYLRGYVAKDDDAESARKAFRLVVETLPPADETAQKAKRWLDKLSGHKSGDE